MKKIIVAAALSCTASAAAAELTYGAAFLQYNDLDADGGGSADAVAAGVAGEFRSNNLTFSGELTDVDLDGLDLQVASVGLGYNLANGATVGIDHAWFDIDGFDAGVTSLYGMYAYGPYTLGASIGDSSDLDDPVYSLFGAWDVTATGTVGLDIIRFEGETLLAGYADYDMGRYNLEAEVLSFDGGDALTVSGGYEVFDRWSVIGSLGQADFLGDDLTTVSIGGQYEFTEGANAEVSLGRIDVDGAGDIDVLSVGVNFETGRRTSKRRSLGNIFGGFGNSLNVGGF